MDVVLVNVYVTDVIVVVVVVVVVVVAAAAAAAAALEQIHLILYSKSSLT